MVNATIPHLRHFFQASPRPEAILGGGVGWKDVEMNPVQGGWETLSSSRLFDNNLASLGIEMTFQRPKFPDPWQEPFHYLAEALDKLEEMVHEPEYRVSYVHDAAIQRFEFCIELFWEIFRKIGEAEGRTPTSQKGVVRMAHALDLIDNMGIWLAMAENRNQTSHTYTSTLTKEIYDYIPFYYRVMRKTYNALKGKLSLIH
jgi:nucleotidyltransferase substrate binding protein (TIGR01987 family)